MSFDRARLSGWFTALPREKKHRDGALPLTKIALRHYSAEEGGSSLVQDWEVTEDTDFDTIREEVQTVIEGEIEDVNEQFRFNLLPLFGPDELYRGGRLTINTRGSEPNLPESGQSEPPTSKGQTAAAMRHLEAVMRLTIGERSSVLEEQRRYAAMITTRLNHVEGVMMKAVEGIEASKSLQHERDEVSRKNSRAEERMDNLVDGLLSIAGKIGAIAGPGLIQGLLSRGIPGLPMNLPGLAPPPAAAQVPAPIPPSSPHDPSHVELETPIPAPGATPSSPAPAPTDDGRPGLVRLLDDLVDSLQRKTQVPALRAILGDEIRPLLELIRVRDEEILSDISPAPAAKYALAGRFFTSLRDEHIIPVQSALTADQQMMLLQIGAEKDILVEAAQGPGKPKKGAKATKNGARSGAERAKTRPS